MAHRKVPDDKEPEQSRSEQLIIWVNIPRDSLFKKNKKQKNLIQKDPI